MPFDAVRDFNGIFHRTYGVIAQTKHGRVTFDAPWIDEKCRSALAEARANGTTSEMFERKLEAERRKAHYLACQGRIWAVRDMDHFTKHVDEKILEAIHAHLYQLRLVDDARAEKLSEEAERLKSYQKYLDQVYVQHVS
ncbi:MAG: hypothetical protein EB121_02500, partial [Alphaproteobacteria bacterium]|nr:hypothetical protein [Alphaproteobacteria bacterium]